MVFTKRLADAPGDLDADFIWIVTNSTNNVLKETIETFMRKWHIRVDGGYIVSNTHTIISGKSILVTSINIESCFAIFLLRGST